MKRKFCLRVPDTQIEHFVQSVYENESAELCAAPNGGPARRSDNSRVSEGPPSLS
jgi:hypothetical protein